MDAGTSEITSLVQMAVIGSPESRDLGGACVIAPNVVRESEKPVVAFSSKIKNLSCDSQVEEEW